MIKVAILTNIPSPYRVDLFNYLHESYGEFDFSIIYSSKNEDNRQWHIDEKKLLKSQFLKSFTIKIKKSDDNKYIHIPYNAISILNKINPDIIVGCEYNPTVLESLIWCKLKGKKFLSWSDGTLNSEKNINFIQKISRKFIIKRANAYIASSTKTKETQIFYGADTDKIYVSYLTIDIDKYLYKRNKYTNVNFLYVGSLIKRKGIDLLLNALAIVEKDFHLTIVGDGSEKFNLINQTKTLGLDKKVEFLGFKDGNELKEQYKKSDVFILPTREDCFGLVILEAMCNSMPLIVSKYADGVYDLVKDEENGFIIDPYDIYDMKEKIEIILSDSGLSNKMALKSYELSSKYKLSYVSSEYIKAIRSCTNIK